MQDEMIIQLFFERKEKAITALADKYGDRLLHLAAGYVMMEDARECVNDTYMEAWQHIPPDRPRFLFSWIAKVCRNKALGKIQWNNAAKRKAEVVWLSREMEECIPSTGSWSYEMNGEREEHLGSVLTAFLYTLPDVKRQIFLRRYWFGEKIKDIAHDTGYSESKIKTSLHRTRGQLKTYLEKEGVHV